MKKYVSIFLALTLVLLLSGCGSGVEKPAPTEPTAAPTLPSEPTVPATEPPQPTESPQPTEPPRPTEPAVQTDPVEQTSPVTETEATASDLPYLQKVSSPDQGIYAGPGYDFGFVGTVKEAGTYTIVEEAWDVEDNLWGKLKSGAGWIDLTEVRHCLQFPKALSAGYANELLLKSGNFIHFDASVSDYPVQVVFRANESLTDVVLYSMELHETMELSKEIYSLSKFGPEKPLVVDLDFPGDMTTYAIRYTDGSGNTFCYCICISGRNGALIMFEYTP